MLNWLLRFKRLRKKMTRGVVKDGFVTQLLAGDYRSYSEDRLTQLTAASFNHSDSFRRCFLRFLGSRHAGAPADGHAITQVPVWSRGRLGRLDLIIKRNGRLVCVVENKVDSQLDPSQLKRYSAVAGLKSAQTVALVKSYFEAPRANAGWQILHWRDFYLELRHCLENQRALSALDGMIIRNFIQYLEVAKMHVPTEITKQDMTELAKMLHGLRFIEETNAGWLPTKTQVFETAADFLRMLESIVEESRIVTKLSKVARKKYRFTPRISHWSITTKYGAEYHGWVGIHVCVYLPKPRHKTKSVGVGLFVDSQKKWCIEAFRNVTDDDEIDEKKIMDGRGNVVLTDLSKKVLSTWDRWLR